MGKTVPRCSIVIPVYNGCSATRQCLDVLLTQSYAIEPEIIVVDDGSHDLTKRLLSGYGERIRVVTHSSNMGFATACNNGAAVASGEYLIFLNNDTRPEAGWLDALARHAEAHPRAAVVGSKLLYPDNSVQHAGIVVCQDRLTRGIYRGFPADHPAVNTSRRFRAVTGACMLVRRAAFDEVEGFDTGYRNAYEDHDLCLRLGERGYEVHYCHESIVYYFESLARRDHSTDVERSTRRFRLRWSYRLETDDFTYYLKDGLLRLTYGDAFPLQMTISPLLAVVDGAERDRQADRLLDIRARQVCDLLKENIRLATRPREARLREGASEADGARHLPLCDAAGSPNEPDDADGRPRNDWSPPADLVPLVGGDFEKTGDEFLQYFTELAGLAPDENVLEVGCGVGRMAIPLTRYLSESGRYEGFDVEPRAISWCHEHVTPRFPNFQFHHADVQNGYYNQHGLTNPTTYRFQYQDNTFDFVFLTSVFTHMLPDDVGHYLSEVQRVLKPGGRCLITLFLLNAESVGLMRAGFASPFAFKRSGDGYAAVVRERPEAAVAFDEERVRAWLAAHRLEIDEPIRYGRWCGRLDGLSLQDIVVARKAGA
jgi:GT2 family glycosyltransferase/SAM-dependent methyltransferase